MKRTCYNYRGEMILRYLSEGSEFKWFATIDDAEGNIIQGNSINEIKNKIDQVLGGQATSVIPKRRNGEAK